MFCRPRRRQKKKHRDNVEVGDKKSSSPQKSVEEDPKEDHVVPDTPAPSATTVSAPAEARKKPSWWRRWRGRKTAPLKEVEAGDTKLPPSATEKSVDTVEEFEGRETGVLEAPSSPQAPVSAAPELQPENKDVAEDTNLPSSATERSVDTVKECEGRETGVLEAPSSPHAPVSAAPELQPENKDVAERSVNTIEGSEGGEAGVQEAPSTPDTPVSAETGEKKKPWWCRWCLPCCKRQKSASPVETGGAERSPPPEAAEADSSAISDFLPTDAPRSRQSTPTGHGGSLQAESDVAGVWEDTYGCLVTSARTETLSREELVCLGFPNLAQTCYMNSTLQGLLTLTPFVQEVHNQQEVLSSRPESRLMRGFVEVGVCHFSSNKPEKKSVLAAFKKTVAEFNSEFEDDSQKDAHEFLSCVLDKLRSLSVDLRSAAVDMGIRYTCPVDAHIAFQMLSTRTCKGCGLRSMRQEDYMNLSLDLVPGGSVSQCLQEYLKESQLEYRCECGAEDSSQQWLFWTLPNVLILQLKRFRFTRSFNLEKVDSPVLLSRELGVNPGSGAAEQTTTRYSLVSIVSHLGSTAHSGHYICDGAHRQQRPGDVTDRWLTYNDEDVSETTGASVCHQRRRTAYLLFYEKQQ